MAEGDIVYIDFDDGVKRVVNNAKLYITLLKKFKADFDIKMTGLSTQLASGDMETAQVSAHTIKGASANLSLVELNKQVLELETQIKARNVASDQMGKVQAAFDETIKEIDKVIAQNA
ncbi:MAG: Hpt domain-containing protein [Treponema sp.]|jgi:HPt (histidine-containing phosphotransfer) domain-containing protein|nr:Hpt domain-containing protein [Treponema sp.]